MKELVIFGVGDASELANYYFNNDSDYKVVAFTVDEAYMPDSGDFCGLPVVPYEELLASHPPALFEIFVALGYSNVNENRRQLFQSAKDKGYRLASYLSSHATILNDNAIGENCFILEDNTIQPFVTIGDNVTLWSGNHIGHHTTIANHCFLASHIVVSGRVTIKEGCFVGVNATFRDHITIGEKCVIGAGALLLGDVEAEGVYVGAKTERARIPSSKLRKI
ncbi:MAG TPA: acetyltransferase [Porticoccaceae bacterium]|nr:acetyltransferase [Porticoccaceae bacterium]